jgi:hypothetical protein
MHKLQRLHPTLNAFTYQFEDALLLELRAAYLNQIEPFLAAPAQQYLFEGGQYFKLDLPNQDYHLCSYDTDPLLWISNNNAVTYLLFKRFFDQLGLAQALKQFCEYRRKIRMYSGFFVLGNRAPEPVWHYDYRPKVPAYTLITPLFDWLPEHGHLLYQLPNGQEQTYRYMCNEAIIFGEGFLHCTQPYDVSEHLRVLVSFTCGSDKLSYWPQLKSNIEEQSLYFALPCGHIYGSCHCLEPNILKKLLGILQFK